ncbi:MAG: capsular polysaccharide synthesis protein [Selenomonadaceae bacterium]|nr:capsular polysaccharide synthesis protein [Selenomonadaceae bacterium]
MAINNPPPRQPAEEQREQQARLKISEQRVNNLQHMIAAGRKDSEFDLFCRRMQMAEIFSNLPPEVLRQIYLTDFYTEFWRLAGEAHRKTKFYDEEKNISRQILELARQEQNPIRRQVFALLLIVFGEMQEAQKFIDQRLWPQQLRQDFDAFAKWHRIISNPLPPQVRTAIARNEQISAFLQNKYSALIKKYSQAVIDEKTCPRVRPEDYQIYFCWLQGEENLPPIIRCCYNSLKQNAGHYKIVFIDEQNFSKYVDLPPHVLDKFKAGKITRTHFSDILRVNLLERYGGLWLDATILVTEPLENHKDFWQMPYFTQKYYHDKNPLNPFVKFFNCYISYARWAGFIQGAAVRHNPLFVFEKEFLNDYWRDFDELIDYVLIDFTMDLAYENIPFVRKEFDAVPINNAETWTLSRHLNEPYAAYPFDRILQGNFLNKLNWKSQIDMTTPGTVFREIQRRYAPETIK